MIKDIKENFIYSKIYWICIITTCILSYGFSITNLSINADDMIFKEMFLDNGLLAQGRWGTNILKIFFDSYEFIPYWRDFLGLIFLVFGSTLIAIFLKLCSNANFSDYAATIFSCIFISFPLIAHIFVFTVIFETGVSIILTALSLLLAFQFIIKNKFVYGIYSFFILAFATSFIEYSMVYFLSGTLMGIFLYCLSLDFKYTLFTFFKHFIKIIFIIVMSLIFWKLGAAFFKRIYGIKFSNYTSGMIIYNKSNFILSFFEFIYKLPRNLFHFWSFDFTGNVVFISTILVFFISLYISLKQKKIFLFVLGIFIIISSYSIIIITGNFNLPKRVLLCLNLLCSFSISLLYVIVAKLKNNKIKYCICILALYVVLYQSKSINKILYIDYLGYERDVSVMNRILNFVPQENLDKPLIFVGLLKTSLPSYDAAGLSNFNVTRTTDSKSFNSVRGVRFINMHGYSFPDYKYSFTEQDYDDLKKQILQMKSWPIDGSVKAFDKYTIVKFGLSEFDLVVKELKNISVEELFAKYDTSKSSFKNNIDFMLFDNNKINISGWSFFDKKQSTSNKITLILFSEEKQYFINTLLNKRTDVDIAFDGNGIYSDSGYEINLENTSDIESGIYKIYLMIQNQNESKIININQVFTKTK